MPNSKQMIITKQGLPSSSQGKQEGNVKVQRQARNLLGLPAEEEMGIPHVDVVVTVSSQCDLVEMAGSETHIGQRRWVEAFERVPVSPL